MALILTMRVRILDDRALAEQWEKTGSFMGLCQDEAWVKEAARIEDECDGRIEAGLGMQTYAQAKYDDSLNDVRQALKQQMRVQSILFVELHCWMEEWNIGVAFEDTYTEARELVRTHLKQPTPALESWVEAILEEDNLGEATADLSVRAQTRAQLSQMLTTADWEVLEKVAADAAASVTAASILEVRQQLLLSGIAA